MISVIREALRTVGQRFFKTSISGGWQPSSGKSVNFARCYPGSPSSRERNQDAKEAAMLGLVLRNSSGLLNQATGHCLQSRRPDDRRWSAGVRFDHPPYTGAARSPSFTYKDRRIYPPTVPGGQYRHRNFLNRNPCRVRGTSIAGLPWRGGNRSASPRSSRRRTKLSKSHTTQRRCTQKWVRKSIYRWEQHSSLSR